VLVVGAETTLSVFGPILPSFINFFCIVITADSMFRRLFCWYYPYISLI